MSDGILIVQNVTKSYGSGPPVLRNVSFELPPGVTGLLGPNGAGKSTLLLCVLGLLPAWKGRVQVLGLDARRQRRAVRRRVGFMPELDAYIFGSTGIETIRYLARLSGLPPRDALRRAHEVLWHVGLGEAIYRRVETYSTGMRQRFKLAQAIVHDPDLIFLDEPLSGLDPEGRREVQSTISDLAKRHGKHIVWSSHLLPDVQRTANQVVILHEGTFRGMFRLEDLASPDGLFLVEVEGDGERLRKLLETVEIGVFRVVAMRPLETEGAVVRGARRTELEIRGPATLEAGHLLGLAHHAGVRVRRVLPKVETLEDVFLRLLGEKTGGAAA